MKTKKLLGQTVLIAIAIMMGGCLLPVKKNAENNIVETIIEAINNSNRSTIIIKDGKEYLVVDPFDIPASINISSLPESTKKLCASFDDYTIALLIKALEKELAMSEEEFLGPGYNRVKAITEALGLSKNPKAVGVLVQHLNAPIYFNLSRPYAAEALGLIGDKTAVEPLIECLTKDCHWDIDRSVIKALGALKEPKAVEAILNCLTRGFVIEADALSVVKIAKKALINIGRPGIPFLIEGLKNNDYNSRRVAMIVLGEMGAEAKEAVTALIEIVKDNSPDIRRMFERPKTPADFEMLYNAREVARINEMITGGNLWSRSDLTETAIEALGKIGDEQAVSVLIKALEWDNYFISEAAEKALKKIGRPALPMLVEKAKNEKLKPRIRIDAIHTLAGAGDESILKPLENLSDDSDREVREAAEVAINKIKKRFNPEYALVGQKIDELANKVMVPYEPSKKYLGGWPDWMYDQGATERGRPMSVFERRDTDPLFKKFYDDWFAEQAAQAQSATTQSNKNTRLSSIKALGEIKDKRVLGPLMNALIFDKDDDIVNAAREALRKSELPVVEMVAKELMIVQKDLSETIRMRKYRPWENPFKEKVRHLTKLVRCLGLLADKKALGPLHELQKFLLEDKSIDLRRDDELRTAIDDAIEKIQQISFKNNPIK